jgi:hypothetical protein
MFGLFAFWLDYYNFDSKRVLLLTWFLCNRTILDLEKGLFNSNDFCRNFLMLVVLLFGLNIIEFFPKDFLVQHTFHRNFRIHLGLF